MAHTLKHIWKHADVIDFEFFLNASENKSDPDEDGRHQQDRDIFLTEILPGIEGIKDPILKRKVILRRWVDVKRQRIKALQTDTVIPFMTPGRRFSATYNVFFICLLALGFLSGAGLVAGLLTYTGKQPVNVALYLGLVVGVQLFLLFFLFLGWISRGFIRFNVILSIFQRFFLQSISPFFRKQMSAPTALEQAHLASVMGLISGKRRLYGSLFIWPFFVLAQTFGVAFNTGVVLATGFRIIGTDLAFGWQSTLQVSSQAVYKVISMISLPWKWIVPMTTAHPTLEQIEGSRIILKDGIYHLSTSDMVSWWPFILLTVICYGLLPRLALLLGGVHQNKKTLDSLKFDTFECDKLILWMTTPKIGEKPFEPEDSLSTQSEAVPQKEETRAQSHENSTRLLVMLPEDILDQIKMEDVLPYVHVVSEADPQQTIPISFAFETDQLKFPEDQGLYPTHVWILMEAWQPPIKETVDYIKDLRKFLGYEVKLIVFLVGKPMANHVFTPVEDSDFKVWKLRMNELGDPYLSLERTPS